MPIIRAMKLSEYIKEVKRAASITLAASSAADAGLMDRTIGLWQDLETLAKRMQQVKEIEDD